MNNITENDWVVMLIKEHFSLHRTLSEAEFKIIQTIAEEKIKFKEGLS